MKRSFISILTTLLLAACSLPSVTPPVDELTPTLPAGLPTTENLPGLVVRGHVIFNGEGLADVKIYKRFSAYPWERIATTDQDGYYESGFIPIPGDEMVSIQPELEGYTFDPPFHYWRHYHGYVEMTWDFTATFTP